jgi:hypothetical protein
MQEWFERLRLEAKAVASAPTLLAAVIVVVTAVVWGALHWSYRAILSEKDAHIASLERRLADYRDNLSGAAPDEAKRRIETLEAEVEMLRLRLQPRRLTPIQRQAIVDRSRLPAGGQPREVTVLHEDNCSDCASFAADLEAALRTEGSWRVSTQVMTDPAERPRTGLGIRVHDPLRPPSEAVVLQQALRSAGLPFTMLAGGADPTLELLVTDRVPQ